MVDDLGDFRAQQCLLALIELVVVDKGDIYNVPAVLDVLFEEYQLRNIVLLQVHIDVQLHREEGSRTVNYRDVGLLEFEAIVVGKSQATHHRVHVH